MRNRILAVTCLLIVFAPTVGLEAERAGMVLVPAGEFWMGRDDGNDDEKPRHRVDLDVYYIDRYEITNELYQHFMEATRRVAPLFWSQGHLNGASQPVVGVSWDDADAYCRWAGKRLPTEAEWEKAARGDDGRSYPWGEQWDSSRANSKESQRNGPAPVGSYPSGVSPYGAHDMAGNVWEWVADWYAPYTPEAKTNPKGPDTGDKKVIRGGAWNGSYTSWLRPSFRYAQAPAALSYGIGFRCVSDL
jgi:formylglycine-generating enzyme required for sulfatase activity